MSKLLIDDYPILVLPKLAEAIGINEAIVLQQFHYWLDTFQKSDKQDHFNDDRWWVYNTLHGWVENFPWWSESTIRRTINSLKKLGLVETGRYNKKGYDQTLWYTINYEVLDNLTASCSICTTPSVQNEQMDTVKMNRPIPETTNDHTKDQQKTPLQEFDEQFPRKFQEYEIDGDAVDLTDKGARDSAIIEATERHVERASSEPWRFYGEWIKPRNGIPKRDLQRVLWLIVTVGGVPEPNSDALRKRWPACLGSMYKEALGNWDTLKLAAQKLRDTDPQYRGDIGKWAEKYVLAARTKASGPACAGEAR